MPGSGARKRTGGGGARVARLDWIGRRMVEEGRRRTDGGGARVARLGWIGRRMVADGGRRRLGLDLQTARPEKDSKKKKSGDFPNNSSFSIGNSFKTKCIQKS